MKTLDQINEGREAGTYAVGKRSSASPVIHLLYTEEGSTQATCNRNGLHTGRVVRGLDTAHITCKTCLRALGA